LISLRWLTANKIHALIINKAKSRFSTTHHPLMMRRKSNNLELNQKKAIKEAN
jgi:hypothetical protein